MCLAAAAAFDATLVAADYALPLDPLVLQLKFGGRLALAALFARCLRASRDDMLQLRAGRRALARAAGAAPAGRARLQPGAGNRPAAGALAGVALHPRLAQRVHETQPQTRLTPTQRRDNIAGAFGIARGLVDGRHVGIVDDVMTSGQTLDALAATFKRYGAARVTNLVARARRKD